MLLHVPGRSIRNTLQLMYSCPTKMPVRPTFSPLHPLDSLPARGVHGRCGSVLRRRQGIEQRPEVRSFFASCARPFEGVASLAGPERLTSEQRRGRQHRNSLGILFLVSALRLQATFSQWFRGTRIPIGFPSTPIQQLAPPCAIGVCIYTTLVRFCKPSWTALDHHLQRPQSLHVV